MFETAPNFYTRPFRFDLRLAQGTGGKQHPLRTKRRRRGGSASRSSVPAELRAVGLKAGAALGPDEGAVRCPGRKIEAVARLHRHVLALDLERDAATGPVEHLVVGVRVDAVGIARAVGPGRRGEPLGPECRAEG